ncbi:MAG TPA: ornithine cyclodeaminase family protein [Thermoanaerobaculia bacterium]|jgi:ornithine cyclodeaminase/alanine dehydrogenase-like protein (mu-crystallin family)|nr:ornithine cyclodeaminase family protein [Thermoanaerobaculia bacterium]
MGRNSLLSLSATDIYELLDPTSCIDAVERAFRLLGVERAQAPVVCGLHVEGGVFHIKAAVMDDGGGGSWFAAKVNANFPGNPKLRGLPTIQGAVLLMDAVSGEPRALMDSASLTALRTAAATAVAVRWLARAESTSVALAGCGVQGRAHLRFVAAAMPKLGLVRLYDPDGAAVRGALDAAAELGIVAEAAEDLGAACRVSDVCITCTPSRRPLLGAQDVSPGTLVAGVGADNEEKHELAPGLLAKSVVIADVLAQCEGMGDLHHAIAAGAMRREEVRAELGEVIAGRRPGRTSDDEVVVFDSTGMALQDVAAAVVVYERAVAAGRGTALELGR